MISFTAFTANDQPAGQSASCEWPALTEWIVDPARVAPSKDSLPLLKLSTFQGDYRSNTNLSSVYGVEGDYDAELVQPSDAVQMLQQAGIEALLVTTSSHRHDAPRWRVFCPLSAPVPPSEHRSLVARLNGALGGILGGESFTLSQPYYVGSVYGGEPVQHWHVQGRYIDQASEIVPVGLPVSGGGTRHDLGDPALAAPSLEWVAHALSLIDPNGLDRATWLSVSAAVKQAAWTLTAPETIEAMWTTWTERYEDNNPAESAKLWRSIRSTELGWPSLMRRVPSLRASVSFGANGEALPTATVTPSPAMPTADGLAQFGEMLTPEEQSRLFNGCLSIISLKRILDAEGRFHDQATFNMKYGGHLYVWNSAGKTTDEAWKAATRGTQWKVPQVDHIRFLPDRPYGEIILDEMGRKGLNVYKPIQTERTAGDPGPFVRHIAAILPDQNDQHILLSWLAHNVQFPGAKIPWAPVIQSAEGAGKGVIKAVMSHAIGKIYTHYPSAKELTGSGSTFNGWMRNKLFILADEIKVDDKRDLMEVLKPLITEKRIEVQSKGVDQVMEDNYCNWLMFSNWKDAIPVSANGRRYAIFYSPIQTHAAMLARGMDDVYFDTLFAWLESGGFAIVNEFLHTYPIDRRTFPMRAPKTSSYEEAVRIGRSPVERAVQEAIEDGLPGFRGGWVSMLAAAKRCRAGTPPHVISGVLEGLGYVAAGRAPRPYHQEDVDQRADLFVQNATEPYGKAQGYE